MIKDNTSIEEFREISSMTTRCYNVCIGVGISTFGEFMDYTFTINSRNMGKNTLREIISLKSKYKDERIAYNEFDFDQCRYEIAKDVLTTIMGRISYDPLTQCACCGIDGESPNPYQGIAHISVQAADALISELKKGVEK